MAQVNVQVGDLVRVNSEDYVDFFLEGTVTEANEYTFFFTVTADSDPKGGANRIGFEIQAPQPGALGAGDWDSRVTVLLSMETCMAERLESLA